MTLKFIKNAFGENQGTFNNGRYSIEIHSLAFMELVIGGWCVVNRNTSESDEFGSD